MAEEKNESDPTRERENSSSPSSPAKSRKLAKDWIWKYFLVWSILAVCIVALCVVAVVATSNRPQIQRYRLTAAQALTHVLVALLELY